MGEGPKDLRSAGATPAGAATDSHSAETAILRAEIEQKRSDISGTLDEIQGRLRPRRLVSEATGRLRERASTAASRVANTTRRAADRTVGQAREHPWSAAAAAAGVGAAAWWFARRARENREFWGAASEEKEAEALASQIDISEESLYRDFGDDFAFVEDDGRLGALLKGGAVPVVLSSLALGWWLWRRRRGEDAAEDTSWNGGVYGSAGADAGSYRTFDERWPEESGAGERSMRRAVEDVKSKARSAASAATERTRDIAGRARRRLADRGRTAGDRLTEWVNQNPIGAGAMALLAGLVIGLAIPESAQEHRVLGAARDRLIENARRAGREALAVARDTVIEAATGRRTA